MSAQAQEESPDNTAGSTGPSLARNSDFNKLWAGQSISLLGSELTKLALPLTAIIMLQAEASQIGLLNGLQALSALVLTLFAGVLIDRVRRKPLMIGADLGRALFIGLIPILAFTGGLNMGWLYVVALVVGGLSVVFEIAYVAFLPSLLSGNQLIIGNSRLQGTESTAGVVGPSLGGALVNIFKPAYVLIGDAISFLVSAFALALIRQPEPPPAQPAQPAGASRGWLRQVFADITTGVRAVYRHDYARPLVFNSAGANFGSMMILTLFILYANRELGLSAAAIGLIYAAGGAGGIVAAVVTNRLVTRFGFGHTTIGALVCFRALAFTPLVVGPDWLQITLFSIIWFVTVVGVVMGNVAQISFLQVVMPHGLQGRVIGALRILYHGILPVSAVVAGYLGDYLGLRNTIFIGAVILIPWILWVIYSPVRGLKSLEDAPGLDEGDGAEKP